jgi:hypothetical protein
LLGEIKNACHHEQVECLRGWLEEPRQAARDRLLDVPSEQAAPTLVVPVDQAEELFNADAGEAPHFLELLASLVQHEAGVTPALIVAATIRADRYEPLQTASELAGVRRVVFDELGPLPAAGYTEVITGPARRATAAGRRLTVEPALVDRLLTETAEGADALPLLALTLERLYHDFGAGGDLTVAEYESLGGMAQVVQTEVDQLLAADPEQRQAQLDILHDAFIPWLATINPDSDEPMRRLARWDDLPAASHPLIQAMVEKRLLVKDTRDGQAVVEVALESLLRQWRELAAWLRDEAQDLKDADSLERAAADWRASDGNEAWLLEGTRLVEAEALATKPRFRDRLDPTRDFLRASRGREDDRLEAEKQRQQAELQAAKKHAAALRKRSRILIAVLAITVVIATVAVVLGVQANHARKQADARFRVATSLRLVSEAQPILQGALSDSRVRAYQRLVAARRLAQTPDDGPLVDALRGIVRGVQSRRQVNRLRQHGRVGAVVGCGHRPTRRPAAARPHQLRDQRSVQPRRNHHRLRRWRQQPARVAHVPRPRVGDVQQTRRQHEPQAMARLGVTRHRLHQGLPRPPGRAGLAPCRRCAVCYASSALVPWSAGHQKCRIVLTAYGFARTLDNLELSAATQPR